MGGLDHLVRPILGVGSVGSVGGNQGSDATKILDQGKAKHDWEGPELTQLQRGDRLVCGDKTTETLRIDAPVAVRNCFQRDSVHPGQTRGRTFQQTRQFPAVTLREMFPSGADLLFDQVKIVEQPFSSRSDSPVGGYRLAQQITDSKENIFVLVQSGQELVGGALQIQLVHARQVLPVQFHLVGSQQF